MKNVLLPRDTSDPAMTVFLIAFSITTRNFNKNVSMVVDKFHPHPYKILMHKCLFKHCLFYCICIEELLKFRMRIKIGIYFLLTCVLLY